MILAREKLIKYSHLFTYAFVVSMPYDIRINSILMLCLCAIKLLYWSLNSRVFKWDKHLKWKLVFISLYLIHIIGFFYSDDKKPVLELLESSVPLFIFPIVMLSDDLITKKVFKNILITFVATCLLSILICWVYVIHDLIINNEPFSRIFAWRWSYYNLTKPIKTSGIYMAMYVLLSIYILFHLIKNQASIWLKTFAYISIALFVIFIIHLSSRMGIVALAITAVIYFIYNFIYKRSLVFLIPLGLLFIILSLAVLKLPYLNHRFKSMISFENYELNLKEKRVERWKAAVDIFLEHPLFGVGSGDDLSMLMEEYKKRELADALRNEYNVHNQYLQFCVANGILGVILFLMSLVFPLYKSWSTKSWLYLFFIISFSLGALSESTLRRQKGIIYFAFFNSVFVARFFKEEKTLV